MKTFFKINKSNWHKRSALLVIFLISHLVVSAQVLPEIKQARGYVEADQKQKAIALLEKTANSNPLDASVWYYLGLAQLAAENKAEAAKAFETGLKKNEKEALNHVGKGHIYLLESNIVEARKSFDQAIALTKSKNADVLNGIARAYLTDARYAKEAISFLEKSKGLDKRNPETHLLLGEAFILQNNGGLSVSAYETAASLDPSWATPHYKIALVYMRSKNTTVAEESFLKAVQVDPNYTLAYKELGELYYVTKKANLAVSNYAKYLELTENPESGKLRYAFFLFMAREYVKANELFKELIQKPDASVITVRYYAYSLFEAEDFATSRATFDQYFTKAKPEELEAQDYAYYGELLLKLSEDSLAIESFSKSLALDKDQVKIQQLHAETAYKSKRYPLAVESYNNLISLRTKPLSQDYFSLGRALYFTADYAKADTIFQKLAEMQPNMTIGFLWQGRSQANLDPETELGLAKAAYEKVIEIGLKTPDKSKADLIEAYSYMGYYHFVKKEIAISKGYWEKVLALNPNDVKATEFLKSIK